MAVVRSWLKVTGWGTGSAQLLVRKGSSDQHTCCVLSRQVHGCWMEELSP